MEFDIHILDWYKMEGLVPAIIQDAKTGSVLMLGYMNQEALQKTLSTREVTFYSRSKKRLWTKGETTGNKLIVSHIVSDCDQDSLLVIVNPEGPVCHTGSPSCFGEKYSTDLEFLYFLSLLISERADAKSPSSYVNRLFKSGVKKIAQKIGEEGVEVALAAMENDPGALCEEAADLLFHLLVLLEYKRIALSDVILVLKTRRGNVTNYLKDSARL